MGKTPSGPIATSGYLASVNLHSAISSTSGSNENVKFDFVDVETWKHHQTNLSQCYKFEGKD